VDEDVDGRGCEGGRGRGRGREDEDEDVDEDVDEDEDEDVDEDEGGRGRNGGRGRGRGATSGSAGRSASAGRSEDDERTTAAIPSSRRTCPRLPARRGRVRGQDRVRGRGAGGSGCGDEERAGRCPARHLPRCELSRVRQCSPSDPASVPGSRLRPLSSALSPPAAPLRPLSSVLAFGPRLRPSPSSSPPGRAPASGPRPRLRPSPSPPALALTVAGGPRPRLACIALASTASSGPSGLRELEKAGAGLDYPRRMSIMASINGCRRAEGIGGRHRMRQGCAGRSCGGRFRLPRSAARAGRWGRWWRAARARGDRGLRC
jgi:hypothetical protein